VNFRNLGDIGQTVQTIETESDYSDSKHKKLIDNTLSPIRIYLDNNDDTTLNEVRLETKFSEPSLIPDESETYEEEMVIEEVT